MISVHQQNRFRFPSERRVNEHPALARLLNERLMGADSGAMTAKIRSAQTVLPKPMLISFMARLRHSMFCVCSRIFSSSALISTTVLACSRSFPFEPIVLASRLNS